MANVCCVTLLFIHVHLSESVMSVTMALIKEDARSVGDLVFQDAYYCKECTICEKDVSANYHINNHITEFWGWLIKKMPEVGSYLVVNDVKSRD